MNDINTKIQEIIDKDAIRELVLSIVELLIDMIMN